MLYSGCYNHDSTRDLYLTPNHLPIGVHDTRSDFRITTIYHPNTDFHPTTDDGSTIYSTNLHNSNKHNYRLNDSNPRRVPNQLKTRQWRMRV